MSDAPSLWKQMSQPPTPFESRLARALRGALNANGEIGSGLAMLMMTVVVPAMTDPDLSARTTLVPSGRVQGLLNILAGAFFMLGVVQLLAVLLDRRITRTLAAYIASIVWICGAIVFLPFRFYGITALGVTMGAVNVLAAARGRLQVQEWQRLSCTRAESCPNRLAPKHGDIP